jgi:predicted Zn-dependent peptidase
MADRFSLPEVGPLATVRFPAIARSTLPNGVRLWCIERHQTPAVTAALVIHHGTSADPSDRPGLTSFLADLLEEGAGGRDAIALADALARIGGLVTTESGSDATTIAITALSRHFDRLLALLVDLATRPHFEDDDFRRVRDLRRSRLRQLSQSASASADRAFIQAIFGPHPYGHGTLGTSAALEGLTLDHVRRHWERTFAPSAATLILVGDLQAEAVFARAASALGAWTDPADSLSTLAESPVPHGAPDVLVVDRPGASQSELRLGHLGPPRTVPGYHAIAALNALLGGQFTSRINRNLRETRGITYGASTSFDMRRRGGSFCCLTGVQSSATALAVSEILSEISAVRSEGAIAAGELDRARAGLTRGYVRQFETTAQLARAAVILVTYELPDDTFDRFVPGVERVTVDDVTAAARQHLHPDRAVVVIVGDEARCHADLETLGRTVRTISPEF